MKDFLTRFKLLGIKLVGVKGVIFITASVGLFCGLVPGWAWLASAGMVAGIRYLEKIKDIASGR
jgi:hypothetical protein